MKKLPKNIRKLPVFGRMALSKAQEGVLDTLWAKAVKKRAGDRCEKCFRTENLQSHHVVGRRNKTLRHIVSNGCSLCAKHHMWAEQNGVDFAKWILEKRGEAWWNYLQVQARQLKTFKEFTVLKTYLEGFINDSPTVDD